MFKFQCSMFNEKAMGSREPRPHPRFLRGFFRYSRKSSVSWFLSLRQAVPKRFPSNAKHCQDFPNAAKRFPKLPKRCQTFV